MAHTFGTMFLIDSGLSSYTCDALKTHQVRLNSYAETIITQKPEHKTQERSRNVLKSKLTMV